MKPFTKRLTAVRGSTYFDYWKIAFKSQGSTHAEFCRTAIQKLFKIPKRVASATLVITNVKPSDFEGVYVATMNGAHRDVYLYMPDQPWHTQYAMTWSADLLLYKYFERPGPIYIWVEYE